MQRRGLVIGNWKMNGTLLFTQELACAVRDGVLERIGQQRLSCDLVLCPPFTGLSVARHALSEAPVGLGGQNMSDAVSGPYTGEISGAMLRDVGCSHVLLGHSERRTLFGEENAGIARKMAAAFQEGLQPVICLGETLQERTAERTLEVIRTQWMALVPAILAAAEPHPPWILAYEPVWAIGTGRHATPDQIQEVHGFIRQQLSDHLGATVASRVQILYGGSVTPANAAAIFAQQDVDGGLIGGASLAAATFLAIADAYPKHVSIEE
ncbi:MAG: triose-phosphate isomerase [Magnetococcales bacterium]|nr:triose-phosphate isomerase [Magnetococcales bacterium]